MATTDLVESADRKGLTVEIDLPQALPFGADENVDGLDLNNDLLAAFLDEEMDVPNVFTLHQLNKGDLDAVQVAGYEERDYSAWAQASGL